MTGKRPYVFPSLLFGLFFLFIIVTGFVQIRIIKNNVEGLLRGEGEIVYNYIRREIDNSLEYVSLLEKSPTIVTPNFFNVMVSDEAIAEDLYNMLANTDELQLSKIALSNYVVFDTKGVAIARKGNLTVSDSYLKALIAKKETVLRLPAGKDNSLFMGIRIRDRIFFLRVDDHEMELLRKKAVIQDILDTGENQFNVMGIRMYDPDGKPFLVRSGKSEDAFVLSRPLNSQFLPGYRIDILISTQLAKDTVGRTSASFVFILFLLVFSGAVSIFALYILQRKHEKHVEEMEKDLALKERLISLGKLASGMAHEIRNPLNAISLSVQRLKREFLPEHEKEEYLNFLDIMRKELIRVDNIVEDFLLSARAHAPFVKENLYTILDEVITIVTEKALSRKVIIINKLSKDIVIESQRDRLKQAFYNIILNGIEAIHENGSIEIVSKEKNDTIEIHIKDSGPGIRKEDIHRIFEYYYTTKDKGMGLGLPISYMIVRDHGGDIQVESGKAEGTTFLITLPLMQKTKTVNQS